MPSNINLTGATVELVERDKREYYLKSTIKKFATEYDYIFIDCPPSLGILTLNGITNPKTYKILTDQRINVEEFLAEVEKNKNK